ncbi:kinase-like domain-containing protein [Fennellomyces sp. T-0311]|nr:kinase-like domain-containing protein [Fennellomyces sp. T-0311]
MCALPVTAVPRRRGVDWPTFYKNGYPKEVIVIEDSPPLPPAQCTRSKRKRPQDGPVVTKKRVQAEQPVAAPSTASLKYPCIDDKDGHLIFRANYILKGRYKTVAELGKGTFGQVFKCKDTLLGDYVAVKVIRAVPKYREASKIEIRVLETLKEHDPSNKHQCIQLRGTFSHYDHVCMVFDMLDQSVFDFLKFNDFHPFPLAHVQDMAHQILQSVAYLHDQKLVHTDLKPENIMLVSSASRTATVRTIENGKEQKWVKQVLLSTKIQLIDFGSATFEDEYHSSIVSTRHYRAPEIILGTGWSYPCDIWSIGCVLVELFTGDALFQTHENLEHLAMMEVVLGKFPPQLIRSASPEAKKYFYNGRTRYPDKSTSYKSREYFADTKPLADKVAPTTQFNRLFLDLLQKMLTYCPKKRITPRQALAHPFFHTRFDEFGHVEEPTPPPSSTESL